MAFPKGRSGNPRGRPPGSANKTTVAFKTAVLNVFNNGGGEEWLLRWAKANPTEYFKIAGRLIPHEISGAGGGPIAFDSENISHVETARRLVFALGLGIRELESGSPMNQVPNQRGLKRGYNYDQ